MDFLGTPAVRQSGFKIQKSYLKIPCKSATRIMILNMAAVLRRITLHKQVAKVGMDTLRRFVRRVDGCKAGRTMPRGSITLGAQQTCVYSAFHTGVLQDMHTSKLQGTEHEQCIS